MPFHRIDTDETSDEQEKNISDVNGELVIGRRVGMFKNFTF